MRRGIAVVWHAVSFALAAVLYFYFVLPRWPELTGDISHTWGTVLRIVTGAVLGLTALPVVFTLLRTRRPEFSTPQLALNLRMLSSVGHVLAGTMIVVTAIVEIWISLNKAGTWLFGVYGAAAAIAVLSAAAFYLAFLAELPPPPPKPLKPKKGKPAATKEEAAEPVKDAESESAEVEAAEVEAAEPEVEAAADEPEAESESEADAEEPEAEASGDAAAETAEEAAKPARTRLRNRRPRKSAGVAVSED